MKLTYEQIVQCAIGAGFMVHSGYGHLTNQVIPVADTDTLRKFAESILAEAEMEGK